MTNIWLSGTKLYSTFQDHSSQIYMIC